MVTKVRIRPQRTQRPTETAPGGLSPVHPLSLALFLAVLAVAFPHPAWAQRGPGGVVRIAPDGTPYTGKVWLLVVGIDRYKACNPLLNAVRDAQAVRDALTARYVVDEVVELYDDQATAKAIYDAFARLNRALGPKDCLLIYYSGHGEFDKSLNTGFWIPVNGQPGEPATFVANDVIRRFISGLTHAQHVLLF